MFARLSTVGLAGIVSLSAMGVSHAFVALNLTPGTPDIDSSFITVDYIGNNSGGVLTASGFASVITPPGSPAGNIAGGTFDINSNINSNAQTARGTLSIGGTIASLGFNSGSILTGTFSSTAGDPTFGAGAGDPLEFLFDITGGDAAGLYGGIGATSGVILSQSGYAGGFASNFSSGPFQALSNTFAPVNTTDPFPMLALTPATPMIDSSFITVDYIGNNSGGVLTASGFASVITPPGSPAGNIAGGTFDINSNINSNAQTARGTLSIGGTIASLGFNSGSILTGTFSSTAGDPTFGAGAGDPLEFLFDITGGDAAGLYGGIGATSGVILSQSGYAGSFASNFSSGPFQALSNTFAPESPPLTLLGDVNLDGEVNGLDVDPFVALVTGGTYQPEADMNLDAVVNGLDVDPFVAAVLGGGTQQIPEPSTLLLALVAPGVVGGWRKWGR